MTSVTSMFFIFLIILIFLFAVAIKVFLCLFIYSDAKEHSESPALWVILVLFIPDFIGVLIYFLLGRKRVVICPACSARMPEGSRFCTACGCDASAASILKGFSKSTRRYLIALIVTLGLILASVVALVITALSGINF